MEKSGYLPDCIGTMLPSKWDRFSATLEADGKEGSRKAAFNSSERYLTMSLSRFTGNAASLRKGTLLIMKRLSSPSTAWTIFHSVALAATLAHVLIDYTIGLFGKTSAIMSPLQAANILLLSLVYAYWLLSMGWVKTTTRGKSALLSLLLISGGWSFFANGAVGMLACLPPCQGAFPYSDIAHIGSLLFGGLAAFTTWQEFKARSEPINWLLPISTIALMLATFLSMSLF